MSIATLLRFIFLLFALLLIAACEQRTSSPSGLEAVYDASRFRLTLSKQRLSIYDRLLEREIFSSSATDLISARRVEVNYSESHNSYNRLEKVLHSCTAARVDRAEPYSHYFQLIGHFESAGCELRFYLRFTVTDMDMHISVYTSDESFNQLSFGFDSNPHETLMGFGAQPSKLNFNGEEVPVWLQRQGTGRGEQPISTLIEANAPGASGTPFSSPYVIPYFLSDRRYAMHLLNSEYSRFDFRKSATSYIHVDSPAIKLQVFSCLQLVNCVNQMSAVTGLMKPLPDWVHSGALIGLGGGSERVLVNYNKLKTSGAPISGLWIEDWMGDGKVHDNDRQRPSWNLQLDTTLYPDWQRFTDLRAEDNLQLLANFSPRLGEINDTGSDRQNLYREALEKGFLVMLSENEPYNAASSDDMVGLVNLTNPEAYEWLKGKIIHVIDELQLSGWDAERGENLPVNAILPKGLEPLSYHNLFPLDWARLNLDIIERIDADSIFVMQAGTTASPGITPLFRLSDQNTSWDQHDGLQSALIGLINAGLSGMAISYADIGGNTSMKKPIPSIAGLLLPDSLKHRAGENADTFFALHRRQNLLKRWLEAAAFMPVFRTREGLLRDINAQVYDDSIVPHFRRFATLFAALAPYRKLLLEQAGSRGLPLIRHPALQFPDDARFLQMTPSDVQFMLGNSIMVAPKVTPKNEKMSRKVILPEGEWIELWTQNMLTVPRAGLELRVTPRMGQPPVYLLNNDTTRDVILPALWKAGIIEQHSEAADAPAEDDLPEVKPDETTAPEEDDSSKADAAAAAAGK